MKTRLGVKRALLCFSTLLMCIFATACEPSENATKPSSNKSNSIALSEEVSTILNRKIARLEERLGSEAVRRVLLELNASNSNLNQSDISRLDKAWRAAAQVTPQMKSLLGNDCAKQLREFQAANKGFSEIFITDKQGLNACQTNRTTDYYQADEEWWQKAYNKGRGEVYFGNIEYDESSQTEGISIYLPIREQSGELLGITKAVINIKQIKEEF